MSAAARFAALCALTLGACDTQMPGEVVGTYKVVMRLDENTCGPFAAPFPDGEGYTVELRADGSRGYWRLPPAPPFEGRRTGARFDFHYAQALELGLPDAGTSGCTVLREDQLRAEVTHDPDAARPDAGAQSDDDDDRMMGEHVIGFRADPTGRCRDERGPLRDFERLPCHLRYRLEGTARSGL